MGLGRDTAFTGVVSSAVPASKDVTGDVLPALASPTVAGFASVAGPVFPVEESPGTCLSPTRLDSGIRGPGSAVTEAPVSSRKVEHVTRRPTIRDVVTNDSEGIIRGEGVAVNVQKAEKRGGGLLPSFKKYQEKVSPSWISLQRKVARRSAAVTSTRVEWPRLLATAEDVPESEWDGEVARWRDVARANHRLPPTLNPASSVVRDSDLAEEESFSEFEGVSAYDESIAEESTLSELERPFSLAGLIGLTNKACITSEARHCLSSVTAEKCDATPAVISLRNAASFTRPVSKAEGPESFLRIHTPPYARSPAVLGVEEEHRRGNVEEPFALGVHTSTSSSSSRKHSKASMLNPPIQDQVLTKLSYLQTCRGLLGNSRYTDERRMLESRARAMESTKYAFSSASTSARGNHHTSVLSRPSKKNNGVPCQPAVIDAGAQGGKAIDESCGAVAEIGAGNGDGGDVETCEGQESEPMVACRAQALIGKPATKAAREACAVAEFGALCQQSKVTAPILGSFAVSALGVAGAGSEDTVLVKDLRRDRVVQTLPSPRLAVSATESPRQAGGREDTSVAVPLNIENWSLGDAPMVALAGSSLGTALGAVDHHSLRGNRLSCEGISAIAARLGKQTSLLDLADNSFGPRGAEALVAFITRGAPRLRLLNMSRNSVGDAAVANLAQALLRSALLLEHLVLSDVNIGMGQRSGVALGELLETAQHISSLDLSYNMLQGDGAYALLQGLHANGSREGNLRRLSLAWNCLGRGKTHGHVSRMLGSVFHDCSVLFHLDISFNHIGPEDCKLLANGLRENHTLWGFHVDGNSAVVDPDGFFHVLEDEPTSDMQEEHATQFLKRLSLAQGRGKKGKKGKQASGRMRTMPLLEKGELNVEMQARMTTSMIEWQYEATEKDIIARRERFQPETQQAALPTMVRMPPSIGEPMSWRAMDKMLGELAQDVRSEFRSIYIGATRCPNAHAEVGRSPGGKAHSTSGTQGVAADDGEGRNNGGVALRCRSCWVCGGWVEVPLVVRAGALSIDVDLEVQTHVYALLSLDNFARPLMLQPDASKTRWSATRFLPPVTSPLLVVFQVGDRCALSLDLPRATVTTPVQIRLQEQRRGPTSSARGVARKTTAGAFAAQGQSAATKSPYATVGEVNLLDVAARAEYKLKSEETLLDQKTMDDVIKDLGRSRARPRLLVSEGTGGALVQKEPRWTRRLSVWAEHPCLEDKQFITDMLRCLDVDWRLTRTKLNKGWSESDVTLVHKALQKNFRDLWCLYHQVSTVGRHDKDTAGVTLHVFAKLLHDAGVSAAHPHLTPESFDCLFLACKRVPATVEAQARISAPDGLVRWQFLEAVVRIGEFCRRGQDEALHEAVARVVENHFAPLGRLHWEELCIFRRIVFTEVVDDIFKMFLGQLQRTFLFFADSKKVSAYVKPRPGKPWIKNTGTDDPKLMCWPEWMYYLYELGIIEDHHFTERLAIYAHAVGTQVNTNEASTTRHMELTFVEFLMAVAWVIWIRCGQRDGTDRFVESAESTFRELNWNLLLRTQEWQSLSTAAHTLGAESRLKHWKLSMPWLVEMKKLTRYIFEVADDNRDGLLSLRELRFALAGEDIRSRLSVMGVEIDNVAEFFTQSDRDNSGGLTPLKALHGFACTREKLKRDEQAIGFFKEVFCRSFEDPDQPVTRAMFEAAAADDAAIAKSRLLHIDFGFMNLWEFLSTWEGAAGLDKKSTKGVKALLSTPTVTLEGVLRGYLARRHPERSGRHIIAGLREHLQRADPHDSGSLNRDLLLDVLKHPRTSDTLQRFGFSDATDGEAVGNPLDQVLQMVNESTSSAFTEEDVVDCFVQAYELVRQRELGECFDMPAVATPSNTGASVSGGGGSSADRPKKRKSVTVSKQKQ